MTLSEPSDQCAHEPLPPPGYLVVRRLTRSGRFGAPNRLTIPGYLYADQSEEASLVLDDSGQLAAGVTYEDATSPSSCEPHGNPCCSLAAIATWKLGGGPGALDALAPYGPPYSSYASVPALVLTHSRINALWTTGNLEFERPLLEQAYGRFGTPLHTALLGTGTTRSSDLALRPGGHPLAAWMASPVRSSLRESGTLEVAVGASGGLLRRRSGHHYVPRVEGGELGFASDDEGQTVFAYEPREGSHGGDMVLLSGDSAHPFSHHRVIGHLPNWTPHISAGGHERLLLVWAGASGRIYVQLGSVSGPFGKPAYLGTANGNLEGEEYEAFIDSRGQAVVLFEGSTPHRPGRRRVFAAVAPPSQPFGAPRPITPPFGDCGLRGSSEMESRPLATSPDGHALILASCEHGPGYLVRYAP